MGKASRVLRMPPPAPELLTKVSTSQTSLEQVTARITETMTAHAALLQRYHEVWYEAVTHTWGFTNYLGVGILKAPNDLWAYHDILLRVRPRTVLEMGTFAGGSALWFATLMDMLGIDGGVVYTVDISHEYLSPFVREIVDKGQGAGARIRLLKASSIDPAIARDLNAAAAGAPRLVVLDSDHSAAHVRAELDLYAPACKVGDRLTVEDTNVSWPHDRGARGGLEDYLADHPGEWRHDLVSERWLLTMHSDGWLERI